jgi:hypothetical protein
MCIGILKNYKQYSRSGPSDGIHNHPLHSGTDPPIQDADAAARIECAFVGAGSASVELEIEEWIGRSARYADALSGIEVGSLGGTLLHARVLLFLGVYGVDDFTEVAVVEDVVGVDIGVVVGGNHYALTVVGAEGEGGLAGGAGHGVEVDVVGEGASNAQVAVEEGLGGRTGGEGAVVVGDGSGVVVHGSHVVVHDESGEGSTLSGGGVEAGLCGADLAVVAGEVEVIGEGAAETHLSVEEGMVLGTRGNILVG